MSLELIVQDIDFALERLDAIDNDSGRAEIEAAYNALYRLRERARKSSSSVPKEKRKILNAFLNHDAFTKGRIPVRNILQHVTLGPSNAQIELRSESGQIYTLNASTSAVDFSQRDYNIDGYALRVELSQLRPRLNQLRDQLNQ